jgi:hypothetical protein
LLFKSLKNLYIVPSSALLKLQPFLENSPYPYIFYENSIPILVLALVFCSYGCSNNHENKDATTSQTASASMASTLEQANDSQQLNGFKTAEELGAFLIATGDCDACHSPKKISERGPVVDSTLRLSGHPAQMPAPQFPGSKQAQGQGFAFTQTMTSWAGPWGISYAANLTPDATGIGGWTEGQFIKAIREGKYRGVDNSRPIMPPMPWESVAKYRDYELKAMFAYLKTLKPISNQVPAYSPPVAMAKK